MKKILLVEDNLTTAKSYKAILRTISKDIKVEVVVDADVAAKRIPKNDFDLLITDVNLKNDKIDGFKLARLAYVAGKPVMIITGSGIINRIRFYLMYHDMCESTIYLHKPINAELLRGQAKELLNRKKIDPAKIFQTLIKDI